MCYCVETVSFCDITLSALTHVSVHRHSPSIQRQLTSIQTIGKTNVMLSLIYEIQKNNSTNESIYKTEIESQM